MTRTPGCTCSPARRAWLPDGTCARCSNRVLETQIQDVVRATLIAEPACLLWRNELGMSTHFPDGTPRKAPIRYGVCSPGGADLLGLYGPRILAVETKTVIGRQSADQVNFERWVTMRGGVYAIARSQQDAQLLAGWLRADQHISTLPTQLRGRGFSASGAAGEHTSTTPPPG